MQKKYYDPYYKIDNTDLYISGGIGVSNFNFRLFNRPSYNLYRFKIKGRRRFPWTNKIPNLFLV